jgi:hypothetical protein
MKPVPKSSATDGKRSKARPKDNFHKSGSGLDPASQPKWRPVLLEILSMLPNLSGRFCPFCKINRQLPMDLHREHCAWRRAWELIDSDESG